MFRPLDPDDPRLRAQVRLVNGGAAVVGLLVALVAGLALALGESMAPAVRVAGALLLVGVAVGIVALLRWAGRWSWRYDEGRTGVSSSEAALAGAGAVIGCGLLYEPLGPWALLVFPLVTVALAWLHLGRARRRRPRPSR